MGMHKFWWAFNYPQWHWNALGHLDFPWVLGFFSKCFLHFLKHLNIIFYLNNFAHLQVLFVLMKMPRRRECVLFFQTTLWNQLKLERINCPDHHSFPQKMWLRYSLWVSSYLRRNKSMQKKSFYFGYDFYFFMRSKREASATRQLKCMSRATYILDLFRKKHFSDF